MPRNAAQCQDDGLCVVFIIVFVIISIMVIRIVSPKPPSLMLSEVCTASTMERLDDSFWGTP